MRAVLYTEPGRKEPYLISDFKGYNRQRRNACVSAAIAMIRELMRDGQECRFIKGLGAGVYELKTLSRGGHRGGARVYFFVYQGLAVLCRAECKGADEDADTAKLGQTAYWAAQFREEHKEKDEGKKGKEKEEEWGE